MHNVAVLEDGLPAFGAESTGSFQTCFGLMCLEVFERADLRSDETSLNVGANHTRSRWTRGANWHGPRSDFFLT